MQRRYDSNEVHATAIVTTTKTFHPQLFHDLSPDDTLREMNQQFLPIPETGTDWTHN